MGANRDKLQGYAFVYSKGKIVNFGKDWKEKKKFIRKGKS